MDERGTRYNDDHANANVPTKRDCPLKSPLSFFVFQGGLQSKGLHPTQKADDENSFPSLNAVTVPVNAWKRRHHTLCAGYNRWSRKYDDRFALVDSVFRAFLQPPNQAPEVDISVEK